MLIYNFLKIPDKPIQSGIPPREGLSSDEDKSQIFFHTAKQFFTDFQIFQEQFPYIYYY